MFSNFDEDKSQIDREEDNACGGPRNCYGRKYDMNDPNCLQCISEASDIMLNLS